MTVNTERVRTAGERVRENVQRVIVGKGDAVDLLLVALLCEGHALIEDVPGIGKTSMAWALAASLGCTFRRIQFTPDLLPTDITGVSVYNQDTHQFEFRPGPVFGQVILADEINRAGPRTQSALLEAMQERQVTADGVTYPLERPFLVLATQNPVELEGTFPLPEAQLDRFLLRVSIGYPSYEEEQAILARFREDDPRQTLRPVMAAKDVLDLGLLCRKAYVHPVIEAYMLGLVRATRVSEELSLGISPRGTLALYHASQALAALRGRTFVLPDDVQDLAEPVLAHRLMPSTRRRLRGEAARDVLKSILSEIPVPVEEDWATSSP
jgi:MoxR-like ATPase